MVSAFAARQRLVLGQVKVAEKSNEIVAIPKLLDHAGDRGRHRDHRCHGLPARHRPEILDKKADYVLALKGNQGTLRDDVELFAAEQKANGFKDTKVSRHRDGRWRPWPHRDQDLHRIHDVAWLQERHDWPGLKGIVMVESTANESTDKVERETRFYITSLVVLAQPTGTRHPQPLGGGEQPTLGHGHDLPRRRMPHPHRSRSRQLHHHQTHGPQPDPKSPGKDSLRLKRKVAAWDDDFLASLLAA